MDVGMIKKSAKNLLKGYWLRAITALTLSLAVSALVSIVAECTLVLTDTPLESTVGYAILLAAAGFGAFLSAPIMQGFRRIMWLRCEGENPSVGEVLYYFDGFKRLLKYMALYLVRALFTFGPLALIAAPVLAIVHYGNVDLLSIELTLDVTFDYILALCCFVLLISGAILSAFQALRYALSNYIFIGDPNSGIMAALRTSSRICLANKGGIILLFLSFMPWFLLNATGFAQLYTTPYLSAALARVTRALWAPAAEPPACPSQPQPPFLQGNSPPVHPNPH